MANALSIDSDPPTNPIPCLKEPSQYLIAFTWRPPLETFGWPLLWVFFLLLTNQGQSYMILNHFHTWNLNLKANGYWSFYTCLLAHYLIWMFSCLDVLAYMIIHLLFIRKRVCLDNTQLYYYNITHTAIFIWTGQRFPPVCLIKGQEGTRLVDRLSFIELQPTQMVRMFSASVSSGWHTHSLVHTVTKCPH